MTMMKSVLFLCSGNYYRSRYAEIVFNWRAARAQLAWESFSRALNPDPANYGPMSRHTIAELQRQGIPYESYLRMPQTANDDDFRAASHIVAVKEAEHRPLIATNFPGWLDRVEFWHVHDLDCGEPADALPHLDREIAALIERLRSREEA